MLHGVRRYLALERYDRRVLTRAFIWLAVTDIALRFVGFSRLIPRRRRAAQPVGHAGPAAVHRALQYAHWLEVASRHHLVQARCLHRSLVLHRWLLADGLPSQLRIGVRKDGQLLRAHAWVELDGHAVNELPGTLAAFTPLTSRRSQRVDAGHFDHSMSAAADRIDLSLFRGWSEATGGRESRQRLWA